MSAKDIATLFILVGCLAIACPKPTPGPTPPAAVDSASPADCASVCAHGFALGCPWAQPTPKGATCLDVCRATAGGLIVWDMRCRATAATCAAIDDCER